MAQKPTPREGTGGDRLKLNVDWETAAERLLRTPPGSIPKRVVKPRPRKPKPKA
ncbi:MAG: hypothetical protein WD749_02060 [Phycisphaerales bacterium]